MINLEKRTSNKNIAGKSLHFPCSNGNSEYNKIFMAFAKNAININGKLVSPYKH